MVIIKGCFKIMNLLKNFFVFPVSIVIVANGDGSKNIIHIICPIIWTANKKGVRRMEKVDALIEALAEHISEKISSGDAYSESEAVEETKALAELISARANVL